MQTKALAIALLLSGCSFVEINYPEESRDITEIAAYFVGYEERKDRAVLRDLTGVDPVRTEWCAAFVNAILKLEGLPGSDSVSDHPLLARSFLQWGDPVLREEIQRGDLVIFPRGNSSWQGHVGFYIETTVENGKEYWVILGGNQDSTVSYALYNPKHSIGIRRHKVKLYGLDDG